MCSLNVADGAEAYSILCPGLRGIGHGWIRVIVDEAIGPKCGTTVAFEIKLPPEDDLAGRELVGNALGIGICI